MCRMWRWYGWLGDMTEWVIVGQGREGVGCKEGNDRVV